ncbi:SDR family NAD(P)-dependent oxidoreductase [Mycolicibacterium mengxianglii]|uniref:SDR family NAD(P)-dependent oxidoreductase n=1 Tax=Mycolicibacterium mengxianglii TaxID=2736649 RepID=UPI0018D0282D|nr:SDR family oxidoreductase [Mycolicibacterium mengxianglii]
MSTKTALVTGGSRGIGLAVATALARQGWSVMITARHEDTLADADRSLREAGSPHVATLACDLSDHAATQRIMDRYSQDFTSMDALVLNAGVGTAGPIADYPMSRFDKTVDVNLRAPFELLQRALPLLKEAANTNQLTGAKVIALSSLTGVYAEAGLAAYGATKAAMLSLVETLNAEESAHGVTGTAVAPGYVHTEMSAWITDRIPAETMIPVEDIVEIVVCMLRMSSRTVVPRIIVTRAGAGLNA